MPMLGVGSIGGIWRISTIRGVASTKSRMRSLPPMEACQIWETWDLKSTYVLNGGVGEVDLQDAWRTTWSWTGHKHRPTLGVRWSCRFHSLQRQRGGRSGDLYRCSTTRVLQFC
jgi:hypothetical protein